MPTLVASGGVIIDPFNPPQTITLPSSYTTVLNDCIVVALSLSNANGVTVSGGGATAWDVQIVDFNQYGGLALGWGCAAGHTSFIFSSGGGPDQLSLAIAVYQGLLATASPLFTTVAATSSGSSVSTLTSPSLSYTPGQFLVAASSTESGHTLGAPSWSNGLGNTNIAQAFDTGGQQASLDLASTASGSSTTATVTATPADRLRIRIATLTPAATSTAMVI